MWSAFNANQCTKRARGGMRDEYAVSWFMHAGARRGTETCVREHFAGAQVQPLANGRPRGADDDAEARSEVSRSCEPVPKVLPNARPHEREHSDSHETAPVARPNAPERRKAYPQQIAASAPRLFECSGAPILYASSVRPFGHITAGEAYHVRRKTQTKHSSNGDGVAHTWCERPH